MHILVPLDGSQLAEEAIEPAAALLRRTATTGDLTMLRVVNFSALAMDFSGTMPAISESELQAALEGGREYLAQVASRKPRHGIRVATLTKLGTGVAATIGEMALELEADLIVMASHTRTGKVLGSIAAAVMRSAPVPTLIVDREAPTLPGPEREEPLMILVPVDDTPVAEAAFVAAVQLAKQVNGTIRVLRVLPQYQDAADPQEAEETYRYFARLNAHGETQGVSIAEYIAWGDTVEQIANVSQHFPTDLIALGTHGRSKIERLREGSVTQRVLHQLTTPLLIVHPSGE